MPKVNKQGYVLNLFGTGVQLWDIDLPEEIILKLATFKIKHNLTWEEVMFNLEIMERLGFSNWTEFAEALTPIQLLMDDTARIELRKKSRLIELISAKELCSPSSLFSRYEVSNKEVSFEEPKQLRFIIRYKGLVSKFAFEDDAFRMDKLEFKLDRQNVKNEILLSAISLNGIPLSSLQDDLLHVRGELIKENLK
jgi:hypothetical protein